MTDDSTPLIQDRLVAMSDEFSDGDLGEMMLFGPVGFHTFYDKDADALTTGMTTMLHVAFESITKEISLDEDLIRDNHGEVTPETVVTEFELQFDQFVGRLFSERMKEELEDTLRKKEDSV